MARAVAEGRAKLHRLGLAISLVCSMPALAEEPEAPVEAGPRTASGFEWSATIIAQGRFIAEPQADEAVGGFFDQYEYTANKDSAFPIELGVRDARIDWLDVDDHPIFQLRLESPTSNLGISGSGIDQPFFNQRIETQTRSLSGPAGGLWALDLGYARMRTEELRRFPDTGGAPLVFDDRTASDDRFFRDRTGLGGEVRRRQTRKAEGDAPADTGLVSELAFRGGFQARGGLGQRRAHRDPVNDWLGLPEGRDRNVSEVGAGALLGSGGGGWMLSLDFDHERLRWRSAQLDESDLGAVPPAANRPLGFVPDTDRSIARVAASGLIATKLHWNAGYRLSVLEQVGDQTPEQVADGFGDNRVVAHSAMAGLRWRAAERVTLRARASFDRRDDQIDRSSALFNPTGGVQVAPFVEDWRRIVAEVEGEWRFLRRNSLSLGVRYDDTARSLDFAGPGGARILPENALVGDASRSVEVFAKARLRPLRGLRLKGEFGYKTAPETGYVTELDRFVEGRIDARYTFATRRPLAVTAFVRGDSGSNDDFEMVGGLGPDPNRPRVNRRLDRWQLGWGVGLEAAPVDRLSIFATFLSGRLRQKSGLVLSNYQRYYQENGAPPGQPLAFTDVGLDDFMNERKTLILGLRRDWSPRFDTGGAYTYTRARALFEGGGSAALDLLRARRRVDLRTQVLDLEGGFKPADGLRVLVGYRFQWNGDGVTPPMSNASAAPPIDLGTYQHTFTLGVQIDGRFFARDT